MPETRDYDVLIIGGGVTGTALLYVLTHYTDVRRVALLEKYGDVAQVNSNSRNNSQTLHFGDIETNYGLSKALKVKQAAEILVRYVEKRPNRRLFRRSHKMVLAVGEREVAILEERYKAFAASYAGLKRIERDEIAAIEPKVVEGRSPKQNILALLSEDGYAIDYQKLSESFLEDALEADAGADTFFGCDVREIKRDGSDYVVETSRGSFRAHAVVVASGPYSLVFAQSLGYGKEFGILPVAGSFYFTKRVLGGKVYTIQNENIPFAANHGDPDVINPDETRFGPTAKVLPLLERHKYRTLFDFFRTPMVSLRGLASFVRIVSDRDLAPFVFKNILYEVPFLGKRLFLRSARKIIPSLKLRDLKFGKGLGGIRPQVVDLKTGQLQMGEAKLVGDNIIFITTPSPGASVCLRNAVLDAKQIVEFLGTEFVFHTKEFEHDYGVIP